MPSPTPLGQSKMYAWWDVVCFYLTLPEIETHQHHPIQITIGLDDVFKYHMGTNSWNQSRLTLFGSQRPHALKLKNSAVFIILLFPELEAGKALTEFLGEEENKELDLEAIESLLPRFRALGKQNKSMSQVRTLCQKTVDHLLGSHHNLRYDPSMDPRVLRALDFIFNLPVKKISLEEVSREVHLSPSRFRHIFKDETGIDFRNLLMQLRMVEAMRRAEDNKSLSQIAMETGFTDLPHMTRVFKRIGGTTPSSYINSRQFLEVHIEQSGSSDE